MNERKKIENYSFIVIPSAIIFVAVALVVLNKTFHFWFSSNDDLLIRSILSGDYTGSPDGHAVYLLYPLGLLIKSLYKVFPKVTWYELFTISIHILCVVIIISVLTVSLAKKAGIYKTERKSVFPLFIILFMATAFEIVFCIDLEFLIASQYTALAGLVSATAFLCLISGNDVAAGVLIVLSLWIRKEVFFMTIPLLVIAVIYRLMVVYKAGNNKDKITKTKKSILFLTVFIICAVSVGVDYAAYSSEEWKAFKDFNRERTRVYDYALFPNYSEEKDFYDEIGVSQDEYSALVEYDLALVENIDTGILKKMADRQNAILEEWKQYYNDFHKLVKDAWKFVCENIKTLHAEFALFFLVVSIVISIISAVKDGKYAGIIAVVLMAGYYVAFIFLFTYLGRLPERVIYGLDCMMILGTLYITINCPEKMHRYTLEIAATILGVLLIIPFTKAVRKEFVNLPERLEQREIYESIESFAVDRPDSIFYIDTNVFENQIASSEPVYTEGQSYTYEPVNCIKMTDWVYGSPLRSQKLERLGTKGLYDKETDRQGYLIISDKISTEFILRLLDEKGFTAIKTDSIEGASVWKLQVK